MALTKEQIDQVKAECERRKCTVEIRRAGGGSVELTAMIGGSDYLTLSGWDRILRQLGYRISSLGTDGPVCIEPLPPKGV